MENYSVYVLEADECIANIHNKLKLAGDFLYCEIMYRWDKGKRCLIETKNKNQIICSADTIKKLIELNPEYKDKVQDYDWTTFPFPRDEKFETTDLHISGIPNDYSQNEAMEYVYKRLDRIIARDNYKVIFELRERNGPGFIHGYGKIIFGENVSNQTKFFCKIILHNKLLLSNKGSKSMVSSIWHRNQQTRTLKQDKTVKKNIITILNNNNKPVLNVENVSDKNETETETETETLNESLTEKVCVTESV